jgi:hypothetical protein
MEIILKTNPFNDFLFLLYQNGYTEDLRKPIRYTHPLFFHKVVELDPNTPPETLARLAGVENFEIRSCVAQSPNTYPETLARLANDKNWYVRSMVSNNPNAPPEVLDRLADDESVYTRLGVLENPNTPQYIKEYLTAIKFWRICYGS